MESIELATFYRRVSQWPITEAHWNEVSDLIAALLGAPLVAIWISESAPPDVGDSDFSGLPTGESGGAPISSAKIEHSGIHWDGPGNDRVNLVDLKASLKLQMRSGLASIAEGSYQVRRFQRSESGRLAAGLADHMSVATIGADARAAPTGGTMGNFGQRFQEFGKVLVGTPKTIGAKEEALLLAACQRLAELAEVTQLRNEIQVRSQFLSIASHELKTPLTAIYGVLQLQERMIKLRKQQDADASSAGSGSHPGLVTSPNNDKQEYYLKMVIRQVQRLNELIDGLLDVSRIQNGRFMVEPSEADVGALLSETLQSRIQLIAQEAGVKIMAEAPSSLRAYIDPVRMEEVITNLLMNAIRFSPEGGVVWVRLKDEPGGFRLTVRDQGPNVPLEDRERIFQPFERAARTSRLGGLGLGLFISRQIAQLHGGNVALVESVPGKGNLFEAYFPLRTQPKVVSA